MNINELNDKARKTALDNLRGDLLVDSNGFIYEDDFHVNMMCDSFLIQYCIDCGKTFDSEGVEL